MSAKDQMRTVVPRIPFDVLEKILQYIPSMRDRKNCRLVCLKWLYIMDGFVGLDLKLKKENKAKLFVSGLLRSCSSIKIFESAGLVNWYISYFSAKNLKSVEIQGNILGDNWRILLGSCSSMEFLTVTAHITYYNKKNQEFVIDMKPFIFPAESTEPKINPPSLRRIVFNNIIRYKVKVEMGEFKSVANLLNSIGIAPRLQQVVFSFASVTDGSRRNDLIIKRALLSLMERNPSIGSVGLLDSSYSSSYYQDMSIWNNLLKEKKSCSVYSSGVHDEWQEVLQKFLNVHILYYGIFGESYLTGFRTLITNILNVSQNLKKLFLVIYDYKDVFDCRILLGGLQNLEELCLSNYRHPSRRPQLRLDFLNVLEHSRLKYLYISTPLSEINLSDICSIPRLEELHIKNQESAEMFKRMHFDKVVTHKNLKMIFWGTKFQEKWDEYIHHHQLQNSWDSKKQKEQKLQTQIQGGRRKIVIVAPMDEGFLDVKKWRKLYANNCVVFNKERIQEHDWKKIQEDLL